MLGEFELIDLLRERVAAAGAGRSDRLVVPSGDDAAVVATDGAVVTSVDAITEDVHFRRSTFPPEAIGAKAVGAATSDIAAMGVAPGEIYVQLGLPGSVERDGLERIADGLATSAARGGFVVAGGDVTGSPVLFLAVMATGHAPSPQAAITRSGAKPGDAVLVTGSLGAAAAGLEVLERPELRERFDDATAQKLVARQLEPVARIDAGLALAAAGASAMIDISDGLGADAAHLARASGVGLALDLPASMVAPGVAELAEAADLDALDLAVSGGEDYELLATVPADALDGALAALRRIGLDPAALGRVETQEGVVLRGPTGREVQGGGFQHGRRPARDVPT